MGHRQPSAAEVARTLLTGVGTAALESAATQEAVPVLHAETATGRFILVGDQHTLAALRLDSPVNDLVYRENPRPAHSGSAPVLTPAQRPGVLRLPVRLRIAAQAPVPDLDVNRTTATIEGTLTPLSAAVVPAALRASCSGISLGEVLGYRADARMFEFVPHSARVSAADGVADVDGEQLRQAAADPLAAVEGPLMAAVEADLGPALTEMVRALDGQVDAEELGFASLSAVESARVVGLDRYGMTVLCRWDATHCIWRALFEGSAGESGAESGAADSGAAGGGSGCPVQRANDGGAARCHSATATVRIPFAESVTSAEQAAAAVRALPATYAPAR